MKKMKASEIKRLQIVAETQNGDFMIAVSNDDKVKEFIASSCHFDKMKLLERLKKSKRNKDNQQLVN